MIFDDYFRTWNTRVISSEEMIHLGLLIYISFLRLYMWYLLSVTFKKIVLYFFQCSLPRLIVVKHGQALQQVIPLNADLAQSLAILSELGTLYHCENSLHVAKAKYYT